MNNNIDPKSGSEQETRQLDYTDLLQLWQIIRQRYLILLATFIVIILSGIIYTFHKPSIYQATTTLLIEPNLPEEVNFNNTAYYRYRYSPGFYLTQYRIIKSHNVVKRAYDILYPPDNKNITNRTALVKAFNNRIIVKPEEYTQLVNVSVYHTDPEVAAKEVNTLARVYIRHNLEDRKAASKDAFIWLSEQLAILKAKVKKSELALLKYKEEEDIISLEKRQALLEERIAEANKTYIKASTDYMKMETMLAEIYNLKQSELAESLPGILENGLVQQLKQEYSTLEIQLAKISKKYKPNHPTIISLQSQIDNIRDRLSIEIEKIIKSIEIEARIQKTSINIIENNLRDLKQESMHLAKQAIQYSVLKREAESNRNMYEVLLHRLKETDITGNITTNNIRVVDAAIVPGRAILPNVRKNLLITIVLAIILGIGSCILIDYFDNTIKAEEDIEQYLQAPVLGLVPKNKNSIDIQTQKPNSINRSYSEIKTNLSFYQQEHLLKSLLITSSEEAEGKTTSVYFLGKAFTQSGFKVLIIDADMFNPKLGKILNLGQKNGISDLFLNGKTIDDTIVETNIPGLYALPAGLIPPNPAELIGSQKMRALIENVKHNFDIILIDSPPINASLEVAALGNFVDGIALIVKAQGPSKQSVKKAIKNLKSLKGNIIGVILTSAKYTDKFSYYNYSNNQS